MTLSNAAREFILHWGEMGSRWGVNRTVAQVHALLYLSPTPLTAEDIAEVSTLPGGALNLRLSDPKHTDLTVARDRAHQFKTQAGL